jgi:Domain of unknown function (DUF4412)
MKRLNFFSGLMLAALGLGALLAGPRAAFGQAPGQLGGANTMNAAMLKLFGSNTAFTAKADVHVVDKAKQQTDMPMVFALLDGKTRMETDLGQIKSTAAVPALVPTLKRLGMDQMIVISRPDKKIILNIYPRAKAYAEIAVSREESDAADKNYKLEKTPQGKETIDGHACQKNKVTLTDDKGETLEAVVWNAADLKDFPVQMQMDLAGGTVQMKFKDVKLAKPDAKQFEAPAGLTRYDSAEAILDALTKTQSSADTQK